MITQRQESGNLQIEGRDHFQPKGGTGRAGLGLDPAGRAGLPTSPALKGRDYSSPVHC